MTHFSKRFKAAAALALCAVLAACSSLPASLPSSATPESSAAPASSSSAPAAGGELLTVRFLDVGQADSALIRCGDDAMLIDGGNAADSSLVASVLQNEGLDTLDVVAATHAHEDHVGGLSGALNVCTAQRVIAPVTQYDSQAFSDFVRYTEAQGLSVEVPAAGDTFSLGGAQVTVLGPVQDIGLGHFRIARLLEDLLHAVLNVLHMYGSLFHLILTSRRHAQGQQIDDIVVVLRTCCVKGLSDGITDFGKREIRLISISLDDLEHELSPLYLIS